MNNQLALASFPSGWIENDGKHSATSITTGELSCCLLATYQTRLAYNQLHHEIEIDRQTLRGLAQENFYVLLSEKGWKISKTGAYDTLVMAAQQNNYHPVVEYLNCIEVDPLIQPCDIDTIATNYLETTDPLYDAMLAATLIGAIARALNPGCKFDNCCTLKGGQGIRKSSFWKALARPDWFCDTWQDKSQDLFMAIQTCWFYEIAELDNLTTKKEASVLKALLSSDTDTFRPPYAKKPEKYPRPSVLVGTCNRDDFLNDPTGSRRYWIIDLPHDKEKGEVINIDRVIKDRDSIFKAALIAYRNGRPSWLTDEQQAASNKRNLGFEAEHPFMTRLAEFVNKNKFPFTTSDALEKSGCRDANQQRSNDFKDAAQCLNALGYVQDKNQTRRGKNRIRLWHPASDDSALVQAPESG